MSDTRLPNYYELMGALNVLNEQKFALKAGCALLRKELAEAQLENARLARALEQAQQVIEYAERFRDWCVSNDAPGEWRDQANALFAALENYRFDAEQTAGGAANEPQS